MLRTCLSTLLALSLTSAATVDAQKLEGRLPEAKKLFGSNKEVDHQNAGRICVEANNVQAVELLLKVLDGRRRVARTYLAPAHYRDIAWDALKAITDVYARKRVEIELRKNRKNPFLRQWCAHALGHYGDQAFGRALKHALKDRDLGVRRWAAWSLGRLRFEASQPALNKLIHNKNVYIRANAIEALARIDPQTHKTTFLTALRNDSDGGVRCALLGAAAVVYPGDAEALSAELLGDEDWRPRMQAIDNLRRIRTHGSIDGLIRSTKDGRPVIVARAMRYLQEITAQPIRSPGVWAQWWRDHRKDFEFPKLEEDKDKKDRKAKPEPRSAKTVVYNDIPMDSDHAAFLIDRSFAMKAKLTEKKSTKEDAAYDELDRVLTKLRGKMVFNVFGYNEEVLSFIKKPVRLTEKNQKRALKFIKGMKLGRAKDIWKLLEIAIQDPTLDTAYLLSSGEPDIGTYVHWNRVTDHLADMNRFHKVIVHTIVYSERQWYRDQLEKIAKVTGGEFRAFK